MRQYDLFELFLALVFCLLLPRCGVDKKGEGDYADILIHNGTILTMVDAKKVVASVAVRNGRIISAGSLDEVNSYRGPETIIKDLEGRTMLPGFIDAHSHITMAMKTIRSVDLSAPPVGTVTSIPRLISILHKRYAADSLVAGQWILGWGYDPDQIAEKRHPTRTELSKAFPRHPVFLLHVSGHMAVVNDVALAIAGITQDTPDPPNGVIVREANAQQPNGLLQEAALGLIVSKLSKPQPAELPHLFKEAEALYMSHGITTAQDGFTDYASFQFLKKLADAGALTLDIEALASYQEAELYYDNETFGVSHNNLRLSGMKIISDGSPQGKTAFFREPYLTEVPGCVHQCRGFATVSEDRLSDLMTANYEAGIQTYVHANGDGSIELLLDAHEEVTTDLSLAVDEQRTVVIHSQFVGDDQLERYKAYGFVPSFFTNHAFFWGDVHINNLGQERASFLSPMKSAADLGIIATNHTDYTITPINQLFLLWTAVNRTTRSGKVLGPEERISPWEGLKAITINSAFQHRVEEVKGSIEVGKLADFVILDRDPTKVARDEIRDIKVIETIKEGKSIYKIED